MSDRCDFFCFAVITDLSFNNIEVIEGLDQLRQLRDLTLFNNRISKIDNMDSLVDLHIFSIGNNKLEHLDNVSFSVYAVLKFAIAVFMR